MFQSTHSLRSATYMHRINRQQLEGFNPRTPCGVRQYDGLTLVLYYEFQSTHSLRSATTCEQRCCAYWRVSIHALLAECDQPPIRWQTNQNSFNPRTPCGVRRKLLSMWGRYSAVSIHALLAECDQWIMGTLRTPTSFNPRTPCGVRLSSGLKSASCSGFNPRTPCGVRPHPHLAKE